MRRAAMKLHTRDQSPKEGQQENKGTKFSDWKPTRCCKACMEGVSGALFWLLASLALARLVPLTYGNISIMILFPLPT